MNLWQNLGYFVYNSKGSVPVKILQKVSHQITSNYFDYVQQSSARSTLCLKGHRNGLMGFGVVWTALLCRTQETGRLATARRILDMARTAQWGGMAQ